MDLSDASWWWIAAAALVLAELATGTFYLLMLALGTAAGALSAHAGLGLQAQLLVAALVGGGTVALWHHHRAAVRRTPPERDRSVLLDIGERVLVRHWDAHGHARVQYRGADWDARHAGPELPQPGEHVICGIDGNRLLLERAPS